MSASERFEEGVQRATMARVVREVMMRPDYHQMSTGQIRGALLDKLEGVDGPYLDMMAGYGITSWRDDGSPKTSAEVITAMSLVLPMASVQNSRLNHPSWLKIRNDLVYRAWETFADISGGQTALRLTNLRSGHLGVWRAEPNVRDYLLFVDRDMDLVADFILAELRLVKTEARSTGWMAEARRLLEAWGSPPQVVDHGTFISLRNPGVQHPAIVSCLPGGDGQLRLHVNMGLVAEGSLDYVMRCALDHVESEDLVRTRIQRAFSTLRMQAALAPSSLRDKMYERWCAVGLDNGEGQATMWQELGDLYPDHCTGGVALKDLLTHILDNPPVRLNLPSDQRQLAQEGAVRMASKHLPHLSDLRLPTSGGRFVTTSLDGKLPLGEVGFVSIKAREKTAEQVGVHFPDRIMSFTFKEFAKQVRSEAPAGYAGYPLGEFPAAPTRPEICDWYWVRDILEGGQRLAQVETSSEPAAPNHAWIRWHTGGIALVPWANLVARAIAPIPRDSHRYIGRDLPYDEVDP